MKLKIRGKINTVVLTCLIILSIILGSTTIAISNTLIDSKIAASLHSNMNYLIDLIEANCPGEFELNNDELLKGGFSIKDSVILNRLKARTNMEYSLFSTDKRIATTIDNEHLLGASTSQEVIDTVIHNGKSYRSTVEIGGTPYAAYYTPISDSKGNIIGMYFVGESVLPYYATLRSVLMMVIVICLVSTLLAFFVVTNFSKLLSQPINEVLNNLNAIKAYDFTQSLSSRTLQRSDEIGSLAQGLMDMKNTISSLLSTISSLSSDTQSHAKSLDSNSSSMSNYSENIVTVTQEIAANTTTQANNLLHISDIVSTLSDSIDNMSNSLTTVTTTSQEISTLSTSSTTQMQQVTESIQAFNKRFDEFTHQISSFETRVAAVQEMANVIDSISKQTNLLALNAAIEAARAGDAGKGFSVVATQIRSLAEQSQESTKNISDIVNALSLASKELEANTNSISEDLALQLDSINQNIDIFRSIVNSINVIIPQIGKVSTETNHVNTQKGIIVEQIDQASSIAQNISAACEEVASTCEENNLLIEEVSNIATELGNTTHKLTKDLNRFTL